MSATIAVPLALIAVLLAACTTGVASPSTLMPSPGPLEWSRHDLGVDGPRISSIVPGRSGYLGVGAAAPGDEAQSGIWASADGLGWTAVDPPRADRSLIDIVAGGPGYAAISSSPAGVWTSSDGMAWTEQADAATFGDGLLATLASSATTLAVAGQGQIWTSSDASEWEEADVPAGEGNINDITAGGPGFVAVGSVTVGSMETKGAVWTSADGRTWDRLADQAEFARSDLRSVAADGSRLVAGGWTTDLERGLFFTPAAWTSDDGRTWVRATVNDALLPAAGSPVGALEGAVMMAVAHAGDGWIGAGIAVDALTDQAAVDAAIWSSNADGSTWERVPHHLRFEAGMSSSLEFGAVSVVAAPDRVIVAGRTAGPQTTLWISPPQPGGTEPAPRPSQPRESDPAGGGVDATPAPPVPSAPPRASAVASPSASP